MSRDESALQHPEHGRREFGDIVDNAAGIGEKGQDGCVGDAYAVDLLAQLYGLADSGFGKLRIVWLAISDDQNHFAGFRHGMELLHSPPQGGIQRSVTGSRHGEPGVHLLTVPEDGSYCLPVLTLRTFIHTALSGKGGDADTDALDALQRRRDGETRLACKLHFLGVHGAGAVYKDVNGGIHSHSLTFAEKDFSVSGRQAMQLVDVERTHIAAVIPDGTGTLH